MQSVSIRSFFFFRSQSRLDSQRSGTTHSDRPTWPKEAKGLSREQARTASNQSKASEGKFSSRADSTTSFLTCGQNCKNRSRGEREEWPLTVLWFSIPADELDRDAEMVSEASGLGSSTGSRPGSDDRGVLGFAVSSHSFELLTSGQFTQFYSQLPQPAMGAENFMVHGGFYKLPNFQCFFFSWVDTFIINSVLVPIAFQK
jgi:hypothetical protein